ncbi:polar amino acid transport system permease protein [Labrys wisconsinensis]|uniref:Polar amino acid transport system permease protein n=1 Tax=Labrys wisconsinensis TaxID=425677 RepID=A0ABU0JAK4_9HYPH|nr:ectoine/hydroxyectoine ABC transporter permease subunit EhuC [Labrys wisconsinensis]MDQ0470640.1 polar amino acid transport system permease protein [Labrys wisconsinensis]
MDQLPLYIAMALSGAWVTIKITLAASLIAILIALVTGIARTSKRLSVRLLPTLFVELFRGTSCYVQLFWAFFALPFVGISLSPFVASVCVLGANVGSYGSEVVRGAIQCVPRGQTEATLALNFTPFQRFRHVIFPQALVAMLPPGGNLLIDLLKLTPLTSLITMSDLTYNALAVRQQTGSTFVTLMVILVGYFLLSSVIAWVVRRVERRAARGQDLFARPA